jgi:hypothetical protein
MTGCSPSSKRFDYAEPAAWPVRALPAVDQTMRHNPALGIMAELMADRAVKIYWFEER